MTDQSDAKSSEARTSRRSALGRGLGSLLGTHAVEDAGKGGKRIFEVPIEQIHPRSDQPRRVFDAKGIEELASSIKEKGFLSPILVRRNAQGYGLIAGERRWRAAQRAGLEKIPIIIEEADDDEAFELALIENIQREDLNPLEEAEAYQRILIRRGFTQEELGEDLGKDRSTIANALRLLKLPVSVRSALSNGSITMGHARALLALNDEKEMERTSREIMAKKLSVRRTEQLVRSLKQSAKGGKNPQKKEPVSPEIRDLVSRIEQRLATRCQLEYKKECGGKLIIEYENLDDLDRIIGCLLGE